MELRSIYALKQDDNPTEEMINESVMNQVKQLLVLEKIKEKTPTIDLQGYLNKTIEQLNEELNLLNNQ